MTGLDQAGLGRAARPGPACLPDPIPAQPGDLGLVTGSEAPVLVLLIVEGKWKLLQAVEELAQRSTATVQKAQASSVMRSERGYAEEGRRVGDR